MHGAHKREAMKRGPHSLPTFAPAPARAAFPGTNGPIVFVTTGDVSMIQPDGSGLEALWAGREPALSPDGGRIAFSADGSLFVVDLDGSDQ